MGKKPKITIVDTGSANLHSVFKACKKVGANVCISSSEKDLRKSDGVIVPGVGSIDAVIKTLIEKKLDAPMWSLMEQGHKFLTICLGMQMLFNSSDEGNLPGLGFVPGNVKQFTKTMVEDSQSILKVPHIGWNSVTFKPIEGKEHQHPIFKGIPNNTYFYFLHSYYCVPKYEKDYVATTNYGIEFCSAVAKNNVIGTQFHPEKSGEAGLMVYENFIQYT